MKKILIAICAAGVCFAAVEPGVSKATISAVEGFINQTLSSGPADNPYELLGPARGTYLNGYGTLFTFELDLINAGPLNPNPFKPKVTPQEVAATHDRKMKNLAILKDSMRTLMVNASGTLEGMPSNDHVSIEAILFYYSWENSKDLPRRVLMTAEKQKLLDAKNAHANQQELASMIETQER